VVGTPPRLEDFLTWFGLIPLGRRVTRGAAGAKTERAPSILRSASYAFWPARISSGVAGVSPTSEAKVGTTHTMLQRLTGVAQHPLHPSLCTLKPDQSA
jgi:hypothetical protein